MEVRETESDRKVAGLLLAASVAGAMIAQQVGGKIARDALFLSNFSVTELPKAVVASAVLSLIAVLTMSRLMAVFGPGRLVPAAFFVNASVYGAEWWLAPSHPGLTAVMIYLHTAAIGGLVISGFWSVVNERFDPHTARHNIARITTGATIGGLLGGLAAERVGELIEPRAILVLLAVINAGCAWGIGRLGAKLSRPRSESPASLSAGIAPLRSSTYLRSVAFLVVAIALSEVFLEYALKAEAGAIFTDERSLVSFFAMFYTAAAALTFLVQVGLSQRSLEKLGLSGSLAVGPGLVIITAAVAGFVPNLWPLAIAAGVQTVIANSLFRSSYELLYTPVPRHQKRPIKVVIDVALARLGTMVGSGVVLLLVALALPVSVTIVFAAAALAGVALWLCLGLHRQYVRELAHSLETGVVALDARDVVDATTRYTMATTTMALDRDRLLREIEELRGAGASEAAVLGPAVARLADERERQDDGQLEIVRTLTRGTPDEITKRLEEPLEPFAAPFVVPLLGRHERTVSDAALGALTRSVDRIAGMLTDAFLDPQTGLVVRRRLPSVLGKSSDRRVVEALRRGLDDEDFDLRFFSGRALASMLDRGDPVALDAESMFASVRRELEVAPAKWREHRRLRADSPTNAGPHRGLEHVFTTLSLIVDREVVKLSFGALQGNDPRLRGTALEYLENVLPSGMAALITSRVEQPPARSQARRPTGEVARDLLDSAAAIHFDPSELEGH